MSCRVTGASGETMFVPSGGLVMATTGWMLSPEPMGAGATKSAAAVMARLSHCAPAGKVFGRGACADAGVVEGPQGKIRAGGGGVEAPIDKVTLVGIGVGIGQRDLGLAGGVVHIQNRRHMVGCIPQVPQISAEDVIRGRLQSDRALVLADRRAAIDQSTRDNPIVGRRHVGARVGKHVSRPRPTCGEGMSVGGRDRALDLEVAVSDQLHVFGSGNDGGEL